MNRLKKKMNSQQGASITFALLLFLVCAVLSSVIIVAGTAASGRISRIAQADQQYYAVTSAASLLEKVIDGQQMYVVKMKTEDIKTTYTDGIAGTPEKLSEATDYYVLDNTITVDQITKNDLHDGSDGSISNKYGSMKSTTVLTDAALNVCAKLKGSTLTINRTLALSSDYANAEALAVTIEENVGADGKITLKVYNAKDDKGRTSVPGNRYTLVLKFQAKEGSSYVVPQEKIVTNYNEETGIELATLTNITITPMTWKLIGITGA